MPWGDLEVVQPDRECGSRPEPAAWGDRTTRTLNVLTSPPGGGFAPAATFPVGLDDLKIAPGHAVLTLGGAPMTASIESVS